MDETYHGRQYCEEYKEKLRSKAGIDVKFDGEDLWYEAMIKLAKLYKIPLKKVKKAIEEYGDNFYYSKVFRDMWKIIEETEKK